MSPLWIKNIIQTKGYNHKNKSKMKITKDTEEKITQLQILEQNLQSLLLQKQTFQNQTLEIDSALKEMESSKKEVYKIVGNIMIASEKEALKNELNSKREISELRLKNIEKQEKIIKEKAETIQKEITKVLKNN